MIVQDCTTPEPCLENYLTKLAPLLGQGNATLFATADEPCGGDAFAVVSQTVHASRQFLRSSLQSTCLPMSLGPCNQGDQIL